MQSLRHLDDGRFRPAKVPPGAVHIAALEVEMRTEQVCRRQEAQPLAGVLARLVGS
ncbi:hypothetical protein [Streptomyces cuspidosporus]|uniref:hypothetical protein n=1 Tax=Streptomyces cuspidosporus TaxID=66882 RepID=UPI0031FC4ECB